MRERVGYLVLRRQYDPDSVDEVVELIADVLCTKKLTIRIGGEGIPAVRVQERFFLLEQQHLKFACGAAGLTDEATAASIRLRRLNDKYRAFSEKAGLPEQRERMKVSYVDDASRKHAAGFLEKRAKSGIMEAKRSNEVPGVNKVCDLDVEKYKCVTPDITTREVIITDERIQHIKDHHPGHYEEIAPFLPRAIDAPDYILEDAPRTGLILKQIEEDGLRMQVVLRLHTSSDSPQFKNSIISAWKISESRWRNYLKHKNILYKSE